MDKTNQEQDRNQEAVLNNQSRKSWLRKFWIFAKVLGKNSAIFAGSVGIIGNLWLYLISQFNANQLAAKQDLSTFATYGKLLKEYRDKIEPAMGRFLSSKQFLLKPKKQSLELNSNGSYKDSEVEKTYKNACLQLLEKKTKTKTGFELFNLPEYEDYREIHNFYETLGFSLKTNLINFEAVFNLYIYPAHWKPEDRWASFDPFYDLERCLRDNWFGESASLPDFSDNFLQLGYNYQYKRLGCDKDETTKKCSVFIKRENDKPPWAKPYPNPCKNLSTLWGRLPNDCREF